MAEHTKGIRVAHVEDGDLIFCLDNKLARHSVTHEEAEANVDYINSLIEQDEARQAAFQQLQKTDEDLLVNVGDMTGSHLGQCHVNAEYEAMVQDYLDTFNHAVSQGVAPIRAVYAFCQGFAITLGCCLRANLSFEVAKQLVTMVMRTATASEKMVRHITTSMSKQ